MHPSEPVLEVRGLRVPRQGSSDQMLEPVDFELYQGEILSLLGLDTGSQSLLIDAILGFHRLAEGETRILGLPVRSPEALDRAGTVRRRISFPGNLTVREVIELVQAHYQRRPPIDQLLERFSLVDAASLPVGELSQEDQRWFACLLAFAGDPELLLLDHATVGMDLSWRVKLWEHLQDFAAGGGAVVSSTHLIEEAEHIASRVIVFQHGEAITEGTPEQITANSQMKRVWFEADRTPDGVPEDLEFVKQDGHWMVDTADPDRVTGALQREGIEWRNLRIDRGNLQSALLQLSREDGEDED